jgi:HAE1 family hydrophobic/amphiphilic exporter-1
MAIVAIIILGIMSLSKLSVDFFPDIEIPTLALVTSYKGAGPKEVEKSVTRLIENAVGSVNDINYIESTSMEGSSVVQVNLNWGANLDASSADIREKLDLINDALPDGAGKPIIFKFSTSMIPIMIFSLSGSDDLGFLYDLCDMQIRKKIEQVPGVANVEMSGGQKKEVHVDVYKNRLQAFGLNIDSIASTLYLENQNVAGGYAYEGVYKYVLRTTGEFKSLDDIGSVIVTSKNGIPIQLKDVADVKWGYNPDTAIVRLNGKPGLTLFIYKEAGMNTVQVADDVSAAVASINNSLPADIKLTKMMDSSQDIRTSIGGVWSAGIMGGLLALLVLFFYLWDFRSSLIIGVSIPLSIIATFILMLAFKVNINIISLAGLMLGVGMMVDSSIVVLENIYHHRRKGLGRYEGGIVGAKEVFLAISASTFTTVAVFLPIVFVEGLVAQIFRDLSVTVTISLLSSLVVSVTVIPMLTSRIKVIKPVVGGTTKLLDKVDHIYGRFLSLALKHKKIVLIPTFFGVLVLLGVLGMFIGKEGFPQVDEGRFNVSVTFPVGTRSEYTDMVTKQMEKDIIEVIGPDLDRVLTQIKGGGIFSMLRGASDYKANLRINLLTIGQRTTGIQDIIEKVRQKLKNYPAKINVSIQGASGFMSSGSPVQIELKGDDLEVSDKLAKQILDIISKIPGVREPMIDREDGLPEFQVTINRDLAAKAGLNAMSISAAIKTGFAGKVATTIKSKEGTDIEIIVRLRPEDRLTLDDVMSLSIPSPTGKLVPLLSLVDFEKTFGPTSIKRKDAIRFVIIKADVYGRPVDQVVADIQKAIADKVYLPAGFSIVYGGSFKDMQDSFVQLGLAFLLAIVLVYAIMASQFESLIAPFVIMFAVPFGALGSLVFLFLTGSTLNITSAAGIVVMVGIVINNGIVLIDYVNQLNAKGIAIDEASRMAGERRLRPVMMTTLTTVLGLIPMAIGMGQGGELYAPLALSILGGLSISTLFTLIVVPTAYSAIRKRFPMKIHED